METVQWRLVQSSSRQLLGLGEAQEHFKFHFKLTTLVHAVICKLSPIEIQCVY